MKISCPKCNKDLVAGEININNMLGLCSSCNEVVKIDMIGESSVKSNISKIQKVQMGIGTFGFLFPRSISLGVFLIVFGIFWDLGSGFGIISTINSSISSDVSTFLFLSGFFLVGFVILCFGLYAVNVQSALIIDQYSIKLVRKYLGFETVKKINNSDSIVVEKVVRYEQNDCPVYGIKIRNGENEKIIVGIGITDDEIAWIRWVIKENK